jgi:hypothetical protein
MWSIGLTTLTAEQVETAKKNGIAYATCYKRVYSYGWDVDKAVSEPTGERFGNPREKGFIFTKTQRETARKNGIKTTTMYERRQRGWSIEEAISIPPRGKRVSV